MKLAYGTIVLVVDGSRMILMRNLGDEVYPDLRVIDHRHFENPPNRDLLSDAPGLDFSAGYPGRSTMEQSNAHENNEERFVQQAALALGEAVRDTKNDVVVVAPPKALAVLRRHYDRTVKQSLIAELDKDFTKHPVAEITRLIIEMQPQH